MRKTRTAIIGLSLLALTASACGGDADDGDDAGSESATASEAAAETEAATGSETEAGEAPEGEPIVFGLLCDTTGPSAGYAKPGCDATKLAIEQLNEEGGVLGRPIEFVEGSDESDATKTPTVIEQLVDEGADVIFLITSSAGVLQSKSLLKDLEVPAMMSLGSNPEVVEGEDSEYVYMLGQTAAQWSELYCQAFEELGYESMAFLETDTPSMVQYNEGLVNALTCLTPEKYQVPADSTDITSTVARIQDQDPDAFWLSTSDPNFEILVHNTMAQLAPDLPRYTNALISALPDTWAQAQPGALDGVVGFSGVTQANPRTAELTDVFGDALPVTTFTAQGWDGAMLMAQAIEAAGDTEGAAVNEALQQISGYQPHFGYTDFTVSFGPDKHQGADGLCGMVLVEWGPDNTITGPWSEFAPDC